MRKGSVVTEGYVIRSKDTGWLNSGRSCGVLYNSLKGARLAYNRMSAWGRDTYQIIKVSVVVEEVVE